MKVDFSGISNKCVHINEVVLMSFLLTLNIFHKLFCFPAAIYLLTVNNRNPRTRCEICSKLTIKTPERRHWRRSGVFVVNSEHENADWVNA